MKITPEDIQAIIDKQVELAKSGNTAAAEFVFNLLSETKCCDCDNYEDDEDDDFDNKVNEF